jgi:hypothetical protein
MSGGAWNRAALVLAGMLAGGCDDPAGIVRIHFLMNRPNVVDFGDDAGPPPVDPFDLSRAQGTIEVIAELDHLTSVYEGVPAPADPALAYLLWLSASENGGGWTLAAPLTVRDDGKASAHLDQADVPFPFLDLRAAIVTLEDAGATEPSSVVVLTGVVGNEPEAAASGSGEAPGHEH